MKQANLRPILVLYAIAVLISCKQESAKVYTDAEVTAESKKVNDFFQKAFDDEVGLYPEWQTYLGMKTNYGKLDDNSPAAEERDLRITKKELVWLTDSVNVDALSKDALLSYKLFKQSAENDIADYKYRLYNYPVNQRRGAQSSKPAFLINMHRIDSVSEIGRAHV
jgi:uncharacterized protein (DUF885 family)